MIVLLKTGGCHWQLFLILELNILSSFQLEFRCSWKLNCTFSCKNTSITVLLKILYFHIHNFIDQNIAYWKKKNVIKKDSNEIVKFDIAVGVVKIHYFHLFSKRTEDQGVRDYQLTFEQYCLLK